MAIIFGYLGNDPVARVNGRTGKTFYAFRLAEPRGNGTERVSKWYDVTANLTEIEADMLSKKMLVKVIGNTENGDLYTGTDGKPRIGDQKILASKVEPYTPRRREGAGAAESGAGESGSPEPGGSGHDDIPSE